MKFDRNSDVTKNVKIIEWMKKELILSVGDVFDLIFKGVKPLDEALQDTLANIIMITYLLAKRLGISFSEIDYKIKEKIRIGIDQNHSVESWYGDFSNLKKHKGISLANSLRLEACFEIAKRINKNKKIFLKQLSSPEDVYKLYSYLSKENTEKAVLVLLNKKRCIIKEKIIDGKYTSSVTITAKEIINEVLMSNAFYLVLIHNHPNEECDPSEDDNIATEYLLDILHTIGACLFDHIIISSDYYYSYSEHQKLPKIGNKTKN